MVGEQPPALAPLALVPLKRGTVLQGVAHTPSLLQLQRFQINSEIVAEVGTAKREFDCGFEEAELVARVIAFTFEHVRIDGLLFEQEADAVGQLDFAAFSFSSFFEEAEDLRRQNVSPDDCQIRGSFARGRLFHNVLNAVYAAVETIDGRAADDAVVINLGVRRPRIWQSS